MKCTPNGWGLERLAIDIEASALTLATDSDERIPETEYVSSMAWDQRKGRLLGTIRGGLRECLDLQMMQSGREASKEILQSAYLLAISLRRELLRIVVGHPVENPAVRLIMPCDLQVHQHPVSDELDGASETDRAISKSGSQTRETKARREEGVLEQLGEDGALALADVSQLLDGILFGIGGTG